MPLDREIQFNSGLETVIRESKVQTSGTIFNHMVQILGYADDIDIIGRSKAGVEEALDDATRKLGLVVNTNKTKYMIAGQERGFNNFLPQIYHCFFEQVEEFVYFGSQVNATNKVSAEKRRRITSANSWKNCENGKLRWAGHVARMGTDEIPKKLPERLNGTRPRGRPKLRRLDGVKEDSRTLLGVSDWRAAALNRLNWWKLLEEARTQ
ncbi:uncharacterized protein [Halyomorpha halys]|uniref:uncharacterized protein n=1 Tax=Halyomorpha halys TaxID=286706 RepID=UPI0034D26BC5